MIYDIGKMCFFSREEIRNSLRFIWKFPTKDVLNFDGSLEDMLCPICKSVNESNEHLFQYCEGTENIRRKYNLSKNLNLVNIIDNKISFVTEVWRLRNKFLHTNN